MRIVFPTLAEFINELEQQQEFVWRRIVRSSTMQEWEQAEHVSCQIGLTATALVGSAACADKPEMLLEFVTVCGQDSRRSTAGSDEAARLRKELEACCAACGLTLRPGKYELF
jgi:hypothetical protein